MPYNLKDRDGFHLTIEEYLLALISLVEELVRSCQIVPSSSLLINSRRVWLATP